MATTIGCNIRRLRKQSGYSQERLAQLAGISQSWVCKIETGDENPTIEIVSRIARALEVEVAELMQEPADQAA